MPGGVSAGTGGISITPGTGLIQLNGGKLQTIEGEAHGDQLSVLQAAFVEHHALQCGVCTPGMIMAARDLLARNPSPSNDEIIEALAGNLCRCTGYETAIAAVRAASQVRGGGGK